MVKAVSIGKLQKCYHTGDSVVVFVRVRKIETLENRIKCLSLVFRIKEQTRLRGNSRIYEYNKSCK